nr:hypothetical protein [Rhodoferax sp.]
MQRFLKIIAVLAILYFVPKVVMKVMGKDEATVTKKAIAEAMRATNAQLPKLVAPGITMNQVEFQNNIYRLNYDIDNTAAFNLNQRSTYEANAVAMTCMGAMKELSKRGVIFEYQYNYVENGSKKILTLTVAPNKCQ